MAVGRPITPCLPVGGLGMLDHRASRGHTDSCGVETSPHPRFSLAALPHRSEVAQQTADLLRQRPSADVSTWAVTSAWKARAAAFAGDTRKGRSRGDGRATPSRHGLPVPSPRTPAPPRARPADQRCTPGRACWFAGVTRRNAPLQFRRDEDLDLLLAVRAGEAVQAPRHRVRERDAAGDQLRGAQLS